MSGKGQMAVERSATALLAALMQLRSELASSPLGLETPSAGSAREKREAVVSQLDDYILPRLVQLDAPLLAVVGGSTGAGKSTLVNSLVSRRVTEPGVLRPTTRTPVLVHNAADAEWFTPERILPDLMRTASESGETGGLRLAASDAIPAGLAILDAPDLDSVDSGNRWLAAQLLAAADLWLFVTSAARYADRVPWEFLQEAAGRSAAVAMVLDRTPAESMSEVRVHLARMMTARGLRDSPLFSVPECRLDADGLLEHEQVAPILDWLHDVAADDDIRMAVINQTVDGAVRQAVFQAHDIADATAEQADASNQLRAEVDAAYAKASAQVADSIGDGSVLRGEVLGRWRDLVRRGELLAAEETPTGLVGRLARRRGPRHNRLDETLDVIERGVALLLGEHAEATTEEIERIWSSGQVGAGLLSDTGGVGRAPHDLRVSAERAARSWRGGVTEAVRRAAAEADTSARPVDVGGASAAVMVLACCHGSTDAPSEEGAAGWAVLDGILGEPRVRRLVSEAHDDLLVRARALLAADRSSFLNLAGEPADDARDAIRGAARAVEDARLTVVPEPASER